MVESLSIEAAVDALLAHSSADPGARQAAERPQVLDRADRGI
jgi:hypothetical protein